MPVFDKQLNEILPDNYASYFAKETIKPDSRLYAYIDNYTLLSNKLITDSSNWLILPDTCCYLICVKYDGVHTGWKNLFVGPRTRAINIKHASRRSTIIVKFKPGGAYPFVPMPLHEFTDTSVDLSSIAKEKNYQLIEGLESYPALEHFPTILNNFFLRQLKLSVNPLVSAINLRVESSKGTLCVSKLSGKIGLSERHILNVLKNETGLSTKKMLSVTRLLNSLSIIDHACYNVSWSNVAYSSGYSDQSHLIDDYTEMLQATPSVFLKNLINK